MENERLSKKPNKNITFESLTAAVYLLTAKTKEDFCKYYSLAMHDNNGSSIWWWMTNTECDLKRKQRMREKYQAEKAKRKQGAKNE